jgi:hypothetical protein
MPWRGTRESRLKHEHLPIVNIWDFEPREKSILRFAVKLNKNRKLSMDAKQKQRAVIEFLLLEGRPGNKTAIRLHDMHEEAAYSRATMFRWIR